MSGLPTFVLLDSVTPGDALDELDETTTYDTSAAWNALNRLVKAAWPREDVSPRIGTAA